MVHGSRHDLGECSYVKRFSQYLEKPFLDDPWRAGDEDHGHGDAGQPQCIEDVPPGQAGHQHVDQDDVRLDGLHSGERVGARRKRGHIVALTSKEVAEQLPHMRLIIDNHDAARSGWHCSIPR